MDIFHNAVSNPAMISERLVQDAAGLLETARARSYRVVTAESCTGGLIAASLTAVPGASVVLERGFVTYSTEAKVELLGVPAELIQRRGAVSMEVALAMGDGAL
jgi:nicotinamide-nucleotide amidase